MSRDCRDHQTSDGDLDELDDEVWQSLPLALAGPPQDWTGPMDDVVVEDQEDLETDPAQAGSLASPENWKTPLWPTRSMTIPNGSLPRDFDS